LCAKKWKDLANEKDLKSFEKNVDELLTGSAFNGSKINGYELKLSLNVPVNDDQFGIHFANCRYDFRGKEFAARDKLVCAPVNCHFLFLLEKEGW
jgi:hypothetical protein